MNLKSGRGRGNRTCKVSAFKQNKNDVKAAEDLRRTRIQTSLCCLLVYDTGGRGEGREGEVFFLGGGGLGAVLLSSFIWTFKELDGN